MKKNISIDVKTPQYITITGLTYAQVDSWYGHSMTDLKLDIIYPEDKSKKYPCIVWICGGAWLRMDKSAHLAYLSQLSRAGFVVASVQYRTSNEINYPGQLQDIKSAIRYLKAHADRFNIDIDKFGAMGESAGGYLTTMAALARDKVFDVGKYTDISSDIQAAIPWYPPSDFSLIDQDIDSIIEPAAYPESLLLGKNALKYKDEAKAISPISYVNEFAPPFMIIHGTNDNTVPYSQGVILHNELERVGCDVTLISIEGADHADIRFFQDEIWNMIIDFFRDKLKK